MREYMNNINHILSFLAQANVIQVPFMYDSLQIRCKAVKH